MEAGEVHARRAGHERSQAGEEVQRVEHDVGGAARGEEDGRDASGKYDALVCLGVLIRGGTIHFDLIAGEASGGIARAAWDTGVPCAFGVITTETMEQAKAGNKEAEAAAAAIEMADLMKRLD